MDNNKKCLCSGLLRTSVGCGQKVYEKRWLLLIQLLMPQAIDAKATHNTHRHHPVISRVTVTSTPNQQNQHDSHFTTSYLTHLKQTTHNKKLPKIRTKPATCSHYHFVYVGRSSKAWATIYIAVDCQPEGNQEADARHKPNYTLALIRSCIRYKILLTARDHGSGSRGRYRYASLFRGMKKKLHHQRVCCGGIQQY